MTPKENVPAHPLVRMSAEKFREWRERSGLSQDELAKRMGRVQSQISKRESGEIPIDFKDIFEASAAMDRWPEEFLETMLQRRQRAAKLPRREAALQAQWPAQHVPDFIPVYNIHEFTGNHAALLSSPVVDWTPRPPILLNAADAYAIYMSGVFMLPRFRPGQRLYINPHRPPAGGHGVIVFSRANAITIRQYLDEDGDIIRLKQYHPQLIAEANRHDIDVLHTIVGVDEI